MTPIRITQISFNDLKSFFESFDFTQDSSHIQQYLSFIQEASFCYQNIIHQIYNVAEDEVIGFTAIRLREHPRFWKK